MSVNLRLLSGLAVGYVLGTKAGRERYEQLLDLGRRVAGSDAGRQLQAEARQAKERAGAVIGGKASEGVSKARERIHSDDASAAGTADVGAPVYSDDEAPYVADVGEPISSDDEAPYVADVSEPVYSDDDPAPGTTPPSV